MFVGHFGLGFGLKAAAPAVSLGTLFLATQFIDLLWPSLLLVGLEHVEIAPGITQVTPLNFVHYPISHSLVARHRLVFAVLCGLSADAEASPRCCDLRCWRLESLASRPRHPSSRSASLSRWRARRWPGPLAFDVDNARGRVVPVCSRRLAVHPMHHRPRQDRSHRPVDTDQLSCARLYREHRWATSAVCHGPCVDRSDSVAVDPLGLLGGCSPAVKILRTALQRLSVTLHPQDPYYYRRFFRATAVCLTSTYGSYSARRRRGSHSPQSDCAPAEARVRCAAFRRWRACARSVGE